MSGSPRQGIGWAGIVLAVSVIFAVPVPAQFEGAAHIHNLDRMTVVYPAGDPDTRDTNRASADLRATYLTERYGVVASIAADDAVTDEQLRGNLLLLGWENRVFDREPATRPFRFENGQLVFLEEPAGPEGDDLLMVAASPFNPERALAFWSRIDPELDRFYAFPFVGSDWAVFRRYFPVRRGMFSDETEWPPSKNPFAEKHLEPLLPEVLQRSAHYNLRHENQLTVSQAEQVLEAREKAFDLAVARLGDPGEGFRIELVVYGDTAMKEDRTWIPDPVHSVPRDRELHMPLARALQPDPHEEFHLLAYPLFGPCYLTAMYEGLAFSREGREGLDDLGVLATTMVDRDDMPSLERLFDDELLRKITASGVGFSAAGLLVNWIEETGGRELLARAYSLPRGDSVAQLAGWMGIPPAELEPRFHDWIRKRAEGARHEVAYHHAMDQAYQKSQTDDVEGYLAALDRALAALPADPDALYRKGLKLLQLDRLEESRKTFELAIAVEDLRPDQFHLVSFSHYQLGQIFTKLGDPARARASYEAMLELPDRYRAHEMSREAIAGLDGS